MPAPEMTEELKRDIHILKSRGVLDPKRHYKKEDKRDLKYFQMGTIIQGPTEYYSSRLTRKERKETIVDELLADHASTSYYKSKMKDIQFKKGQFTRVKKRRRDSKRK